jgi:LysR family glycine cleavage system transcriptional activator
VDDQVTDLLFVVRVAPLCSPETAKGSEGKTLEEFLASTELMHLKLDDEPRDLLWASYLRQQGLAISTNEGLAFDTAVAAAHYAMTASGVILGDVDMFTQEIVDGRLIMPYEAITEDGYAYYLKLHADDLSDPAISVFRSWLISRFVDMRAARHPIASR